MRHTGEFYNLSVDAPEIIIINIYGFFSDSVIKEKSADNNTVIATQASDVFGTMSRL